MHKIVQKLIIDYHRIFVITIIIYLANPASAVDTLHLTLDNALALAIRQAPSMVMARYDSLTAEGRWRTIRGERYPQIRFSQEIPTWRESSQEQYVWDPDEKDFYPARVQSGDLRWQERIDIDQELPWGASLNLSNQLYRREWYSDDGDDFTEYSYLNRVLLDQPLLAGNPVGRDREIGKIAYDISLINYELQRREVIYSITQTFFGLVSAEGALDIAMQDLELGRSSEELAARKLKAGLIPEVELLQIQVDLARREGSYLQTKGALETAHERLKLTLGIPLEQLVTVHYSTEYQAQKSVPAIDISADRLEIQREQLNLDQLDLRTQANILSERMRASLQAYYELDIRRENFEDLDEAGDRNLGVILHLELPIFGFGSTRGKVETLKAEQNRARVNIKARTAELTADLRQALRNVETSKYRIRISTAAVELSEKSLSITEERFNSGLISSRDLLDNQLELTRARREALNARIDYELALAYLDRIAPR